MASRRAQNRKALRRQCKGKIKHETREEALAHVNAMFFKKGERMHAYQCEVCGWHHVGHISRRRKP